MRPALIDWTIYKFQLTAARLVRAGKGFSQLPLPVLDTVPANVPCRPALYDPEHLSRVKRCAFDRTLDDLVRVLDATHYVEAPLARHHVGKATVVGGVIFAGNRRILHSTSVTAGFADSLAASKLHEDVALVSSMHGLHYFGHWLGDDTSAFEALRDHPGLMSLPLPGWRDAVEYRRLFEQTWRQNTIIRSRSMTIIRDLGFSRAKAARYRRLRERLRRNFGATGKGGQVVFLGRGPTGERREIVNAGALYQRLSQAGIRVVTPEGDFNAFLGALLDAAVIITVEGSQYRHAVYALREGGAILTLVPPERFYVAPHESARCMDMHSGVVIGSVAEGGFFIDPDEVLAMVDRLLSRIEAADATDRSARLAR